MATGTPEGSWTGYSPGPYRLSREVLSTLTVQVRGEQDPTPGTSQSLLDVFTSFAPRLKNASSRTTGSGTNPFRSSRSTRFVTEAVARPACRAISPALMAPSRSQAGAGPCSVGSSGGPRPP
jgi:hypothetical protein